ncbi:MAG TPA: addiction module protein [Opitutaceae bacterium]|nr:addiction module protein [Opitutaceae bacterium]
MLLCVSVTDIQKMTTSERLAAMEQLWDALCHEPTEPISPAWHGAVLTERKKIMNSPDAQYFTLEQLRRQFR